MIELGDKVKDTITDFEGIATAKAIYLNGCIQFLVQPRGLKDTEIIKSEWIDEGQLIQAEVAKAILAEKKEEAPGGGIRNMPSGMSHP